VQMHFLFTFSLTLFELPLSFADFFDLMLPLLALPLLTLPLLLLPLLTLPLLSLLLLTLPLFLLPLLLLPLLTLPLLLLPLLSIPLCVRARSSPTSRSPLLSGRCSGWPVPSRLRQPSAKDNWSSNSRRIAHDETHGKRIVRSWWCPCAAVAVDARSMMTVRRVVVAIGIVNCNPISQNL